MTFAQWVELKDRVIHAKWQAMNMQKTLDQTIEECDAMLTTLDEDYVWDDDFTLGNR